MSCIRKKKRPRGNLLSQLMITTCTKSASRVKVRINGKQSYNAETGVFHFISTIPSPEISQNLPPRKKRSNYLHNVLLRKAKFFFTPSRKSHFSSKLPQKYSIDETVLTEHPPSVMTFVDPSENLINREVGDIKLNGPH